MTQPPAQHARRTPESGWRRGAKALAIALTVAVVAAVAVGGFYAWSLTQRLAEAAVPLKDAPAQPPALSAYDEAFSVLVVGTDECDDEVKQAFGARCSDPENEGARNDVNMLVSVSADPRRVTVVSFPRDLQVPIPECTGADGTVESAWSKAQINTAYEKGGLTCVADTVSELSGQSIPFAAKVSFGNVVNITDAIGGVEVCIGGDGINDPDAGIDWPAGPRVVTGYDALAFLRTRHGVGDGSDLARIGNQQQYLSRLINKLRSAEVLSNPGTLIGLANTAVNNIQPSQSLADPIRIAQLAYTLKDVPFDDITFVQYPVLEDPADRNRVIPNENAASVLWEAIDTNAPIVLTGELGANEGVFADPSAPQPTESAPAPEASTPAPDATSATPAPEAVELPSTISGSKANQPTCSAGNG
ncbi:MAG: transcriptional regulator [Microbacterium sp. 71-36]|uniref:LCP family protein n=1 Tax=unclassified Microbacterium TaxID=2609290 RepID=UPI00086BC5A3|nr:MULTISPECIES: LCP family protein [unclassified Microbacterium]MBN9212819.1 LCP family protein [Microbacterium sp.]ODT36950.1 MAG: transcriptional regulator [Microbacterium sp. SCN 71-17]OJV77480.1 MAG: transcriptional regulator [Microbacterium sp. 71-36]SIS07926.1 transcriptional attenuator, LytR family [Microbacterium sp. RURRCA19A]